MPKETSEEIASLAASYINFTAEQLANNIGMALGEDFDLMAYLRGLTMDIRSIAASALAQTSEENSNASD